MADLTVGVVVIKGLLHEIMNHVHTYEHNESQERIATNDNVECALYLSREFCRLYGIEVENSLDLIYEDE